LHDALPISEMDDTPTRAMDDPENQSEVNSAIRAVPTEALEAIGELQPWEEPEAFVGSVGRTMFDSAGSKDNTVTVLLQKEDVQKLPAQAIVRINSWPDDRRYLAIVVAGPFAEPDGLRADAPAIVLTAVRGGIFMPRFH